MAIETILFLFVGLLAFLLAPTECFTSPFQQLFLPRIDLTGMNLKFRGQFVDSLVPLERFNRDLGLEIGTI